MGIFLSDFERGLDSIFDGHARIHQGEIGLKFFEEVDRLGAIGSFVFVLLTFWGSNLLSPLHNPRAPTGRKDPTQASISAHWSSGNSQGKKHYV